MLLRGVGKGAAVVAAAVPLQTFAANILKTQDGAGARLCTLSGVGSMLPSAAPRDLGVCKGQTAGHWADSNTAWPSATVGNAPLSRNTKFKKVFGGSDQDKLGDIIAGTSTHSGPSEQMWVRAYLNALVGYPSTFPYSASEVVSLYQGPNSAAALAFFTNFV
ncbi:MAG: hypothetical protein M3Y32_00290 [Pseudomonadota bacterium]|nr:hypothetical protein [Pseudomonadota bacterium]